MSTQKMLFQMPPKKKAKKRGHFCWACHRHRANEKFSGKGHARHICKDCAREQRAEVKKKRKAAASGRTAKNFFSNLPSANLPEELIESVFQAGPVRIERIVSTGQSSPPGFWYDWPEGEWVILLRGEAVLEFPDAPLVRLKSGDYLYLPPHRKHRIFSTADKRTTVWLAVFIKEPQATSNANEPKD